MHQIIHLFLIEYTPFKVYISRSIPALRAGIERADKREFIAHAARGRTRNESHCPAGRCLSARYAFNSATVRCSTAFTFREIN